MRKVIATEQAPAAVGPYSQAIQAGDLIFTAGQLGIDPATDAFAGKDVASQTRQAMENIAAILTAAGTTLDQIVKTTIFVADMGDFQTVNAVYAEFFASDPPARSTVEVSALPLGGRVEIEVIAVVG
jgi:2-iminobutanoate/2-iminopropanoate deaminase